MLSTTQSSVARSKILLNIYYPGQWVLKVNVLETATSNDIKKFIKNNEVELLFNGFQLNNGHSFKFYGLKNEDVLVVVPKNYDAKNIPNTWENISNDEDIFRERISSVIDPKLAGEAGRIRDVQLFKIENKPCIFRKLLQLYQEEIPARQTPKIKTHRPKAAKLPSAQPLPCFWGNSSASVNNHQPIPPVPFTPIKGEGISVQEN